MKKFTRSVARKATKEYKAHQKFIHPPPPPPPKHPRALHPSEFGFAPLKEIIKKNEFEAVKQELEKGMRY